jgi:RNA polymerase sigma factor (sigma-70 family)
MPNSPASTVIEHVRKVVLCSEGCGQTDGQLLHRFIDARDEMAFEALVRRHGPMVLGVCRRLLGHAHDAEDAFQATFLVLARKAACVVPREAVGNWLYGVAYHTALKAQAAAARRRVKERQVNVMPEPQVTEEDRWQDLLPLLDRELSRLPDKYRLATVLCDLEGRSRREVALQLKIPEGTLSSRLTTARQMLARRLRRHGVALAGGALATALSGNATAGSLPGSLVRSTVEAATLFTAGQAVATVSSAGAALLAEGVLKSMFLSKLKLATVFVMAAFGLAAMAGGPAYHALAARGAQVAITDEQRAEAPAANTLNATEDDEDDTDQRRIKGSGKAVTKEMNLSDFTAVDVRSVFQVEITRADEFRTAITADDNLFPYIKVVKEGSTLRISLDSKGKSITTTKALKAAIAMPALEAVTLGGASRVTFKDFKSAKSLKVKVTSASRLDGEIKASQINLDATDAATVTLKGSAKKARISATQASTLHLGDLVLDQADVTLKNASTATVNVRKKLDYEVRNASRLIYSGDPTIGKQERSGASTVSRKQAGQRKKRAN